MNTKTKQQEHNTEAGPQGTQNFFGPERSRQGPFKVRKVRVLCGPSAQMRLHSLTPTTTTIYQICLPQPLYRSSSSCLFAYHNLQSGQLSLTNKRSSHQTAKAKRALRPAGPTLASATATVEVVDPNAVPTPICGTTRTCFQRLLGARTCNYGSWRTLPSAAPQATSVLWAADCRTPRVAHQHVSNSPLMLVIRTSVSRTRSPSQCAVLGADTTCVADVALRDLVREPDQHRQRNPNLAAQGKKAPPSHCVDFGTCFQSTAVQVSALCFSPHWHSWHSVIGAFLPPCVLRRQYSEKKVVVCPYPLTHTTHATHSVVWWSQKTDTFHRVWSWVQFNDSQKLTDEKRPTTPIPPGGNLSRSMMSRSRPSLPRPSDHFLRHCGKYESADCASGTCPQVKTQCRSTVWTGRKTLSGERDSSTRNRISEEMARSELEAMEKNSSFRVICWQNQQFQIAVREYQRQARDAFRNFWSSDDARKSKCQNSKWRTNWRNMKEEWHTWLDPKHEKIYVVKWTMCYKNIKFTSPGKKKRKQDLSTPNGLGTAVTRRELSKGVTRTRSSTERKFPKVSKTWNSKRRSWECRYKLRRS